jgi:hypothetical protein
LRLYILVSHVAFTFNLYRYNAAGQRADLETFLERCSAFGGGRPGLVLQAAAGAVRSALRAQAAALHTLPAAAAARRAAERAQAQPLSAPYVRGGGGGGGGDVDESLSSSSSSGVTLLEAFVHTRRLRVQLATLHSLCLEPLPSQSHNSIRALDGAGFLRRLTSALSAGGVDLSARPLLRWGCTRCNILTLSLERA